MNAPESSNPFKPTQALAPTPQMYKEMTADAMDNMAKASLSLIPKISSGAVVHDNGCGVGAGTGAMLAVSEPSATISVKATDVDDRALAMYENKAAENGWPAEASRMDANALTFPDKTFTHSLMNAVVFVLPNDGIDAVKEIYRTLKPGGIAIINSIARAPNIVPIQQTAIKTRPEGTPLPRQGTEKWNAPDFLQSVIEKGGFHRERIRMEQVSYTSFTKTDFTRFATMLWSFVGGTSSAGWLQSDEDRWDEAIEVLKQELLKAKGFKLRDDGEEFEFLLNVAIATK